MSDFIALSPQLSAPLSYSSPLRGEGWGEGVDGLRSIRQIRNSQFEIPILAI